ncbi:MAG: TetR/AcrR family transcriptional regulator [Rhodoferax sp.]|nr:MAG: TetR/AcrR family transcriptional regulator [Rhodoferax sp.]
MPTTTLCTIAANVRAKRERRKEARPGELLAAALQLFVEKGFAATRAEEVARRAGVSKGTLFLYFSSKDELFKAVVRENISGQFPEWNARFEAYQGSTADLVRLFLMQWWETIGNSPISGIVKLMMSEASNFPELAEFYEQEVIQPGSQLIQRILQRGIDSGEFAPIDLHYGTYTLLTPMLFLATWKHSFGACSKLAHNIDPSDYLRIQSEVILRGLAAPSTTRP